MQGIDLTTGNGLINNHSCRKSWRLSGNHIFLPMNRLTFELGNRIIMSSTLNGKTKGAYILLNDAGCFKDESPYLTTSCYFIYLIGGKFSG